MAVITVRGADLAYDEAGSGPAVVFVHAALADRRMWDHQFAALASRYRVIRYDLRGYGESADAAGSVAHHEDLLALLDALALERAALVGCSMGGQYALDAALAAPERVSALGLICSWVSGLAFPDETARLMQDAVRAAVPDERRRAYRERTAPRVDPADVAAIAEANVRVMVAGPGRQLDDLDPAVRDLALEMCRGVFMREWTGPVFEELDAEPPAVDRMHEVGAPTLVIAGLADVPGVLTAADLLARGIPGARRLDLADTGHLPPLERPHEVTSALTDFLTGTTLRGAGLVQ